MRIQSKVVVGYDLGNDTSQISYSYLTDENIITLSSEQGSIPTQLCKRIGTNQWFFGNEAKRMAGNQDVINVDNLVEQALADNVIPIDGAVYDAKDLLVEFVKKSLDSMRADVSFDQIQLLVITVEDLNERTNQLLDHIVSELPIRKHITMYQSKEEAFFHYIIQNLAVSRNQVLLVDGTEKYLKILRLEMNQSVIPVVGFVEKIEYTFFPTVGTNSIKSDWQYDKKNLDEELLTIFKNLVEQYEISSIFLFGDFFVGEWCEKTLDYLIKPYQSLNKTMKRKVFIGNNLVSKGSCYFAKNIIKGNRLEEQYIFLGDNKLKSDISIQAIENGGIVKKKLLEAGCVWQEASCDIDFIMKENQEIQFLIELYRKREQRTVSMKLVGMPIRPPRTTRVKIKMRMISECLVDVKVEDLGFGTFYPSSRATWNRELTLE